VSRLAVAFAVLCAVAVGSASAKDAPHVPGPALPKHRLTPGAHFSVDKATICNPRYAARVRKVPERAKDEAYARYGLERVAHAYEVDRLVSLGIGGSNAITNLWPEHYYEPWGARTKDRLEKKLHELVCSGRVSLASAQRQVAANWIKAYKRYVGPKSANGATAVPSGSATVALTGTIRAAFYYPWFPQTWGSDPQNPFTNYVPTLGRYSTDLPTVKVQIADMKYAGVSVGLASWFGQSSNTSANWPVLFRAARGTGFSWAPYYEPEGTSDPTPLAIAADLHYLRTRYGGGSALAMLPGKGMLVFVYNADDLDTAHGCATVTRWKRAEKILHDQYAETVYVDLKVFPGYATCADRASIDGWHQYGPASAVQDFSHAPGDGAFAISPGFWKAGIAYGTAPFLARDRGRWQSNIAAMNASRAKWQLITTYNEWGEGTAIESSSGCRISPPPGTYCDWSAGGTSELITDLHNAPPA
jgi:glycosyl hydrolase family 99